VNSTVACNTSLPHSSFAEALKTPLPFAAGAAAMKLTHHVTSCM